METSKRAYAKNWFLRIYLSIYLFIYLFIFNCDCAAPIIFLSLDTWYHFLVHSSILLLMVVQQVVVVLELSQEERSASPSTQPYWSRSLKFFLLLWRDLYYLTQENLVAVVVVFHLQLTFLLFLEFHSKCSIWASTAEPSICRMWILVYQLENSHFVH